MANTNNAMNKRTVIDLTSPEPPSKRPKLIRYVDTISAPTADSSWSLTEQDLVDDLSNLPVYKQPSPNHIKGINNSIFADDSATERGDNPTQRLQQRVYRIVPPELFLKRTINRPGRGLPLAEAQQRLHYDNNFKGWVKFAEDGWSTFNDEDKVPDFDFAERVDLAKVQYEKVMVRDTHGVWRTKTELAGGAKTVINCNTQD